MGTDKPGVEVCSTWGLCWQMLGSSTQFAPKSGILAELKAGCGGEHEGMQSLDVLRISCTGVMACVGERGWEGVVLTALWTAACHLSGNGQLGGDRDLSEAWPGLTTPPSSTPQGCSDEMSLVGGASPLSFA